MRIHPSPRRRMSRDRLRFIFGFLAVFGAALFLVRPEPTSAQTAFRLAIVGTGLLGIVLVQVRGR
jgi:hypothetical protein